MNRGRSSFGVEFEGYVAYAYEGAEFGFPQPNTFPTTAGPLIIPKEVLDRGGEMIVEETVVDLLNNMLKDPGLELRGERVVPPHLGQDDLNTDSLYHLRSYREWAAGLDASLDEVPGGLQMSFGGPGYGWCGFELCSPAAHATDEALEDLRRVCRFLTDRLWISATRRAGLHVHWGNGTDWVPLDPLRRVAGLLYAADPVLVQLHPPHRRSNPYCRAVSLYSRVARGATAAAVEAELRLPPAVPPAAEADPAPERRGYVPRWLFGGERSAFWEMFSGGRNGNHDDDNANANDNDASVAVNNKRARRRGLLGSYTLNEDYYHHGLDRETATARANEDAPPDPGARMPLPRDVHEGVSELLACSRPEVVAELMGLGIPVRPAYSFASYGNGRYGIEGTKRTIEFRQATGSFDPDVVVAWTKVCIRLCEWASAVELSEYWKVVFDCACVAAGDLAWYDVFDLLSELGLEAESRILRRIAYKHQGLRRT